MAEAITEVFAAKTSSQASVVELSSLEIISATDAEIARIWHGSLAQAPHE